MPDARRLVSGMLALCYVACAPARSDPKAGPQLIFPAPFAEGKPAAGDDDAKAKSEAKRADSSSSEASVAERRAAELRRHGGPPDPPPLKVTDHYEYVLVHDRGKVYVRSVRRWRSQTPLPTARRIGRYAIELWIGSELVDRVRFDFPLLAAEPAPSGPRRPLHEPPSLAAGAVVAKTVLVPESSRATRAVLVDRATGRVQPLPWPPDTDASSPGAAVEASE